MNLRTLERDHSATGIRPEPGPEQVPAGDCHPSATQHDPGQDLYAERSNLLAGLFMPPAVPWENLPEQDRNRWRSYAAARG